MILDWVFANANLVLLHHAWAGTILVQLLSTVLLALRVRVLGLHRLVAVTNDNLLLVLRALSMDLRQATILLYLQLLRIATVIDVLNGGTRLILAIGENKASGVVVVAVADRAGVLAMLHARAQLLLLLLLFGFLIVVARAGLGPCVDHFHFLNATSHHSVVRVLVRE
mmetsp:Transcript_47149/g.62427  ORF Transcript_47149/g.62427 Transcript_47149/m.62427 type:complete len:168 (-) Transcript_47149:413-916(-)